VTLGVGVIGTGMIGQDHIRRITEVLSGADVVAVSDVNAETAEQVAARLKHASVRATGEELVKDDSVDAVLVCSSGPTHEEYVLAAIQVGKPVFCEKPLATTTAACRNILQAEVAHGSRLVQVGFMRRYDAAYRVLKDVVRRGEIGAPLMFHSGHRNPSVPSTYTSDMAIVDTAVHDFDVARWLLEEELVAIRVIPAKRNTRGGALTDPLLTVAETKSGVLVTVETSVNIGYGYDIRAELVGESGTASLADRGPVVLRSQNQVGVAVPRDWRERFLVAYDVEFQEWINAVTAGQGATGPSSWDGYAAQAVCEAGVQALHSGERIGIDLGDRPSLYFADRNERALDT
jgi:myo-inositol 2-dehydrogenase/D-chiro-inositol 1-dehydrogenase